MKRDKIFISQISLISVLIILISGCDFLTTREAEKPNKNPADWEQPTTPQILIYNFKTAISTKSSANYLMCFIDSNLTQKSYKYNPTFESYLKYPSIFNSWNLFSEKIYFDNFKSKFTENLPVSFSLLNESFSTTQNDSVTYSAKYKILIEHNLINFPKEFSGSLEFTLYRNIGGLWAIGIWSDYFTDENAASWSQLKGSLSY